MTKLVRRTAAKRKRAAKKAGATPPTVGDFAGVRILDPPFQPKTRTVKQIRYAVRAFYKAKRHEPA